MIVMLLASGASAIYHLSRPNIQRDDDALKYRYIKMKGDASAEQIATLEDIFELNRDNQKIEQMREDVETYEEAVRKQAALAEQARLKEQAAKEQESKAKSIKDKQQPKDNPNKKSKPWAYGKYQGKVSTLDKREQRGNNLLSSNSESCNPSIKDGLPTLYVRMGRR